MAKCDDCGERFDTEQGLWIHRAIEHEEEVEEWEGGDTWKNFVDAARTPRYAFIIGILIGMVVVVSIVLSSPAAFQDNPGRIGERTLEHYSSIAPPGVEYKLFGVEEHDSGTYEVVLQVSSGSVASNETVYVTRDGDYAFETRPTEIRADISALGQQ